VTVISWVCDFHNYTAALLRVTACRLTPGAARPRRKENPGCAPRKGQRLRSLQLKLGLPRSPP
jgi:hypothetical protein